MRPVVALALLLLAPFALTAPAAAGDGCVATTEVDTTSSAFAPACIRVRSGDVVTWTNVGGRPHQLTSDEVAFLTPFTGEPCIQSAVYDGGESVSLLVVREGDVVTVDGRECGLLAYDLAGYALGELRVPYHCTLHPSMQGDLVVEL